MRTIALILAAFGLTAFGFGHTTAQEVGQELTLSGCLAQEAAEGEQAEYTLSQLSGADIAAETVELIPGEDVDLAPHVGHTVEVTGTVAEGDAGEGMSEEGEQESEAEENELHLNVTGLRHIEASCPSGS